MALPAPTTVSVTATSALVLDAGYREGVSVRNAGSETIYFGYGRAAVAGAAESLAAGQRGVIHGRAALEPLYAVCDSGKTSSLVVQEV